jgi:hypothetical protein
MSWTLVKLKFGQLFQVQQVVPIIISLDYRIFKKTCYFDLMQSIQQECSLFQFVGCNSHFFTNFVIEKYTPQRSGLRERRRAESPKQKAPTSTEVWLPEEHLELWQIKLFTEK